MVLSAFISRYRTKGADPDKKSKFQGIHVAQAKEKYDRQTIRQTTDKVIPPLRFASPAQQKHGPPVRGLGAGSINDHFIGTRSQRSRPPGSMRPHSPNPKGRQSILSTRGPTRMATWNVRTMYEQGRCATIS